ncbi:hypothetical protein GCM10010885_07340 [Alicyclobacillus cellulosilyticus]|uniref:Uncharacterized protein n=1 Tax=Alicyclobacillus cellulosilyticus TaxID=1003997 RepID=A0A917K4H2_9BACL|nr:hypothetical protein GCM10010885_07340 [Alicyclobacillus cellulosilyticus]
MAALGLLRSGARDLGDVGGGFFARTAVSGRVNEQAGIRGSEREGTFPGGKPAYPIPPRVTMRGKE